MSSSVIDALPKTYHQPIGPSIERGTGWSIIGSKVSLKPTRASNQLPSFLSQWNIVSCRAESGGFLERVLKRGIVGRADLELAILHAPIAVEHAARGWAGGMVAIGVVNAAMARAHEQA